MTASNTLGVLLGFFLIVFSVARLASMVGRIHNELYMLKVHNDKMAEQIHIVYAVLESRVAVPMQTAKPVEVAPRAGKPSPSSSATPLAPPRTQDEIFSDWMTSPTDQTFDEYVASLEANP